MIRVYRSLLDGFIKSNKLISGSIEYRNNVKEYTSAILKPNGDKFLLIGKVQSGKTLTFTGVICSLFDSGFNCGIVLSGTKLNLHQQTFKRLSIDLSGLRIKVLSDGDPNLFKEILNAFNEGNKILIVTLKHPDRISSLNECISNFNQLNTFLIDDESDQASLNNYNYKNIFTEDFKQSSTFSSITKLLNTSCQKFIQITATPGAHFLTDLLDSFKPSYFGLIPSHENYLGNEHFFEKNEPGSVEIIPYERDINHYYLSKFLLEYLISCVLLYNREISNLSAFIHGDSTKLMNTKYYDAIQSILEEIKLNPIEFLRNSIHDTSILEDDIGIFNDVVNSLKIQKVFGNHDTNIDWKVFFDQNRFFCLIGGAKLERGFTIEGLLYSYIPRTSKSKSNADTLQQRARFFGSKRNLKKYCKVFITEKTYFEFLEYAQNEAYLFSNFHLVNDAVDSANIFSFDVSNPCRRGVISNIKSVIKNKWVHVYIFRNVDTCFDEIINDSKFIGKHIDSGNTENRTHLIFSVNRNSFLSIYNQEILFQPYGEFGDSEEFGNVNYIKFKTLTKLILDQDNISYVKLGGDLDVIREYSSKKMNNYNVILPKNVHSGRSNDGRYIGDSNIYIKDGNNGVTIHVQKVFLDGVPENRMLVLSFFYHG